MMEALFVTHFVPGDPVNFRYCGEERNNKLNFLWLKMARLGPPF